jgi:hypothetical protein
MSSKSLQAPLFPLPNDGGRFGSFTLQFRTGGLNSSIAQQGEVPLPGGQLLRDMSSFSQNHALRTERL